jgi:predicted XRE-type DNA-binding protein
MENFQSMIRDLLATGMSQAQIGSALGKSQAWVAAVVGGQFKDLKWSDGNALVELHRERVDASGTANQEAM